MPTTTTGTHLADLAEVVLGVARKINAAGHSHPEVVQLSSLEGMVMRFIDHHPGTTPSRVAAHVGLKSSNASTALRSLENRGFVRREVDPRDGRSVRVFPTPGAHRNLLRIREGWADLLEPHLADSPDLASAVRLLTALEHSLNGD